MSGTGLRRRRPCCSMCWTRTARRGRRGEASKNASSTSSIAQRKLIRRTDAFVKQSASIINMIPPDETARVYYPGNHGGAMWQPPAFSPLTHYFYTMGSTSLTLQSEAQQALGAGNTGVGQQFGNAIPTEAERKALEPQMIPNSGNLSAIDVNTARSPGNIPAIT